MNEYKLLIMLAIIAMLCFVIAVGSGNITVFLVAVGGGITFQLVTYMATSGRNKQSMYQEENFVIKAKGLQKPSSTENIEQKPKWIIKVNQEQQRSFGSGNGRKK
jgi:uncharacterized membrane protein YgaE (UPF0421/DUF939 family)